MMLMLPVDPTFFYTIMVYIQDNYPDKSDHLFEQIK